MADDVIRIDLAGAPRGQGRPRFRAVTTRDGRHFNSAYKDDGTEKYEAALRARAQDAMGGRAPLTGPLHVSMVAAFPIPASWSAKKQREALAGIIRPTVKPDIDNIIKGLDAINQIVFVDDKQIVEVEMAKFYSDRPRLQIMIRPTETVAIADGEPPAALPLLSFSQVDAALKKAGM